jgi:predicted DNA-binding transcriptional regulator YafY
MNLTRITRLLKLLQTLQNGNGQNPSGLAKSCGVSRRTVFRDLETLRKAGVPLEFDAESQRYFIPSSFYLPPTNLTAEEALSIIALAGQTKGDQRLPFSEPARQAALKLESSLPGPLRDELRSITRSIQIRSGPVNPLSDKQDIYQSIVDSIAKRRVVQITYESLTEWDTIVTKLRPYHLLFSRRSWYVIGRSSLHKELRTFNLGRISDSKPMKQKFTIPRSFSLAGYLRNAWHLIPEPGPDQNIVIRFQPLVAQNVAEVVWHKTQRYQFQDDGCLEFRAQVSGISEIAWWILGYGDQAEVLKPAKLRKLVARRAANMHAIYNGKSKA